jgi:hypothetical protein
MAAAFIRPTAEPGRARPWDCQRREDLHAKTSKVFLLLFLQKKKTLRFASLPSPAA